MDSVRPAHRVSIAFLLLAATAGCNDSTAPTVRGPATPSQPRLNASPAAPGSCSFTIAANEPAHQYFGWLNSGCRPSNKQLVKIKLVGTVTVSVHPNYPKLGLNFTAPSPNRSGSYGPTGIPNSGGQAYLAWYPATSNPGAGTGGFGSDAVSGDTGSTIWTGNGQDIWLRRNPVHGFGSCSPSPQWDCGGGGYLESAFYLVTGSQTLTVEPFALNISLQGPASIWIGDTATYTAQRIGGGDLIVESWLWQPDSGGAPVTPNCIGASNATPTTCRTVPASSGTMYVRAKTWTHGAIEQAQRRTLVSEPSLSITASRSAVWDDEDDRSIEFTAVANPTDDDSAGYAWTWTTSAGASASVCNNGLRKCDHTPSSTGVMRVSKSVRGVQLTASAPVQVSTDSLVLKCTATEAITRGDNVACSVRMKSNRSFSLEQLTQSGPLGGPFQLDLLPLFVASGAEYVTSGSAVVTSTIHAAGRILSGAASAPLREATTSFTVADRIWGAPIRPVAYSYTGNTRVALRSTGPTDLDDLYYADPMIYGVADAPPPTIEDSLLVFVSSGPNRGYRFLQRLALPPFAVWLNPDLVSETPWFLDQNGVRSVPPPDAIPEDARWCSNGTGDSQNDVQRWADFIRRHEGVGGAAVSHYGTEASAIAETNPQLQAERIIATPATGGDYLLSMRAQLASAWAPTATATFLKDQSLDLTEIITLHQVYLHCHFDMVPNSGGVDQ